jgi:hypothetical protein
LEELKPIQRSSSSLEKSPFYGDISGNAVWGELMPDADTAPSTDRSGSDAADEVARINMRIPRRKYEWLQDELDSFTSDTARFQYLIQFYTEHKGDGAD